MTLTRAKTARTGFRALLLASFAAASLPSAALASDVVEIGDGSTVNPPGPPPPYLLGASANGYPGSTAVGAGACNFGECYNGAQSAGYWGTAVGTGASANLAGFTTNADGSTDYPSGPISSGYGGTAIGRNARANNVDSPDVSTSGPATAIGFNSYASNKDATAIGAFSTARGQFSIAIGSGANVEGANYTNAIAIGRLSESTGVNAISLGQSSSASATNAMALGNASECDQVNSTAIGSGSRCFLPNQLVLGAFANSPANGGPGAPATSVFLPGALTVQGNTNLNGPNITLGNNDGSSTVRVPGIARGGGNRFVTVNSDGTLGSSSRKISDYDNALESVDNMVGSVGAMAAALSAIPTLTTDNKNFACGVGTGAFGSAWAGAVGCVGKVASNVWVNGALSFTPSVSTDFGTTPTVGGRLGVFFQF